MSAPLERASRWLTALALTTLALAALLFAREQSHLERAEGQAQKARDASRAYVETFVGSHQLTELAHLDARAAALLDSSRFHAGSDLAWFAAALLAWGAGATRLGHRVLQES